MSVVNPDPSDIAGAGQALKRVADTGMPTLSLLRDEIASAADRWARFELYFVEELSDVLAPLDISSEDLYRALTDLAGAALDDDLVECANRVAILNGIAFRLADEIDPDRQLARLGGLDSRRAVTEALWPRVMEAVQREVKNRENTAVIQNAAEEAEMIRAAVERTAGDVAESVGQIGEGNLAAAFDKLARREGVAMIVFRVATFLLAALAVASPFLIHRLPLLDDTLDASSDWASLTARVIAAAGIAGAAAYAGRQAGNHRRASLWARSIATQLKSLNAFVASIDDQAVRDAVRESMARRMMSEPPQTSRPADPGVDATTLMPLLTEVIRKSP